MIRSLAAETAVNLKAFVAAVEAVFYSQHGVRIVLENRKGFNRCIGVRLL